MRLSEQLRMIARDHHHRQHGRQPEAVVPIGTQRAIEHLNRFLRDGGARLTIVLSDTFGFMLPIQDLHCDRVYVVEKHSRRLREVCGCMKTTIALRKRSSPWLHVKRNGPLPVADVLVTGCQGFDFTNGFVYYNDPLIKSGYQGLQAIGVITPHTVRVLIAPDSAASRSVYRECLLRAHCRAAPEGMVRFEGRDEN